MAINGNVRSFRVTGNYVHDVDNIGIDAIGYEGTSTNTAVDRARLGRIDHNIVVNVDTHDNPSYTDPSAGGIYVDGGADITIDGNSVDHADIGIEVASEHPGRSTERVKVLNNFVAFSRIGGIFIGGFNAGRGSAFGCVIANNTLYQNDSRHDGNGELYVQHNTWDNDFRNNILYANGQGLLIGNVDNPPASGHAPNRLSHNLYFSPKAAGSAQWQWQKQFYNGLVKWKAAGFDSDVVYGNPLLVDTVLPDLHLQAGSPAIDTALPAFAPADDNDGDARPQGGGPDRGADEFVP
jgi:hypothetical protein